METLAQAAQTAVPGSATAEIIVFWIFAVLALASGVAMVTMRNIVHGALMLVVNFFSIAVLYLSLESQFLGIVQIIVYAGAIMVLFLFVIMLLGVDRDDLHQDGQTGRRAAASVLAVGIGIATIAAFTTGYTSDLSRCGDLRPADGPRISAEVDCRGLTDALAPDTSDPANPDEGGSVKFVGTRLFTRFTFPFELSALLLTVATVGALVLGRRTDDAHLVDFLEEPPTPELPVAPAEPEPVGTDGAATDTGPEVA